MPKKKKVDENDQAYPGSVSQVYRERRSSARLAEMNSRAENCSPLTPLPENKKPPRKRRQTKKKQPKSNAIVTVAEVPSHPDEIPSNAPSTQTEDHPPSPPGPPNEPATTKAPPTQAEDRPPSPPNAPTTLSETQVMSQDRPGDSEEQMDEDQFHVSQLDISSELHNLASSTPLPKRSLPKRNDAQHSHSVPNQSLQKQSNAHHNHSVPAKQSLRKRNDTQHNHDGFNTHHSQISVTPDISKTHPPPSNSHVSIGRSNDKGIPQQTAGNRYTFIPVNSCLPPGDSNAFSAMWNPRHQAAAFQTPVCLLKNLAEYSSSESSCEDNVDDRDEARVTPPAKGYPSGCRAHVETGEVLGFSDSEDLGTEDELARSRDGDSEEETLEASHRKKKKSKSRHETEVEEDSEGDGLGEVEAAAQFEVAQKTLTKGSSRSKGSFRPKNVDPNSTRARYWKGEIAHIDLNLVPAAGKGKDVGKAKYVASEGADGSDDLPEGEDANMMELDDDRGRGDDSADFDVDTMVIDEDQQDEGDDLRDERPATPEQARDGNKSQIGSRRSPRKHIKVQTLVTDLMSGERLFLTEQELILAVNELRRRIENGGPSTKLYKKKMDFLMSVPAVAKVIAKLSSPHEETEPARGQKQGKSDLKAEKQKKLKENKKAQPTTKPVEAIATQTKAPAPQASGDRHEKSKRKPGAQGKASNPSGKKVAKVKAPGNVRPALAERPQNQEKTADSAKNVCQTAELRRPSQTYETDYDSESASDQEDVDIVHEHLAKKGVKPPTKRATSKQNDKGGIPKRVAQAIPPSQPTAKTSSKPSKDSSTSTKKKKGKAPSVPDARTEPAKKRHATATTGQGHRNNAASNRDAEDTHRRERQGLGRFVPVRPDELFNVQDTLGPFGQFLPGKHKHRQDQVPMRKRAREDDDDLRDDDDSDAAAALRSRTKTKRRKKTHKKPEVAVEKTKKTTTQSEGESFDINEGESRTETKSLTRSKKGIKGEDKDVLDLALFYERIYFFAVNGFPDPEDITFWTTNAYTVACKSLFRGDWKENMDRRFDKNIQYLLHREAWIVRNKVKRIINKMIGRFYSFHPKRNAFAQYPNAKAQEKAYIQGKIRKLLGRSSLFMCGRLEPDGPLIPFANKAIEELIVLLVFDKSASRRPLAMRSYDTFDPIPLPLIAYAVVALLYGLEEFKTGVQSARDFSSKSYEDYYKCVLDNLREMEEDEEYGPYLEEIRARILESGREALYSGGGVEDDRPPMPFVPSHRRVPPTARHQAPMDREDADESEVEVNEDSDVGSTGDELGREEDTAMDVRGEDEDEDVTYESDEGEDAVDRYDEDGDTMYESDDYSEEE
ncbi:hypothetical protein SCHPADRAFT_888679 [Schizopora paradoxa]|uniref:DUF6532 domain-containing protein n=1 Tax=Schizopora paradoxa TaxID=27342 RepID=A0A0H2RUB2_9AGAM|nr:hypothetical protein SCHPADRAFT_888679 [Schizopora paradoxa]